MDQYHTLYKTEAEIFAALSHPSRLEILDLLRDGESCVCHIQAMLGQRQAYISQHLNILRKAGLITSRKEGLWVYYQIAEPGDPGLFEVIDRVKGILQAQQKWQPGLPHPADPAQLKKPCNCPQCVSEALRETLPPFIGRSTPASC
jgi:DNA-binding transcriptional ArsR family regulator